MWCIIKMSWVRHLYTLGFILYSSQAWQVKMPSNIRGLVGSCLVIPCTFDYYHSPPQNPNRVVWYQYVRHGYPLVYDNRNPNMVIGIFRKRTSRVRMSAYSRECTLKIFPLTWSHHRQKIYPWVDPENVGRRTYRFYDTTVTIEVSDRAEEPVIMISGDMKVGCSVEVQCTVYHTCPINPPTLTLNIPLQRGHLKTSSMYDSTYKTTLTTSLKIQRDIQTVDCFVQHVGGLTARAYKILKSECSFMPLSIKSDEFLEGQASPVTCTAAYTCAQDIPVLRWNYDNMPASTKIINAGNAQWHAISTLMFTASANDNGRSLTCHAAFPEGQSQELSVTLRVKRNMLFRGWSFTTPDIITGMRGSCIIIPCRFSYSRPQPAHLRVVWYLFQTSGYSPVFDESQNVNSKFSGITSLTGSVREGNCSLKIERLEMSHSQDRLYPWVDINPITFYHTVEHTFYDKTSQLIVLDHAQEPQLSITDIPRVGEQSRVSCSVRHTCISAPPTLTIDGILGADHIVDTLVSDGVWERNVERTWTVKEDDQSVRCTVSYRGGQTAKIELRLNVECSYEEIKMTEPPGYATEGVAMSVICSVAYKCSRNKPIIVWNYEDMHSSFHTEKFSENTFNAVSNLTFIGSVGDDGKSLTCTAQFITGKTSDSATIHIKQYVKPLEETDAHENDMVHILAADVPFRFTALTRSCVVIPCSFQHQEDSPLTRGIWSKKNGGVIYHNGRTHVLDHFKDRTKILGNLNEGNCSLEIDDIKPFDNGPFCFHAERHKEKYKFNNSCVFIVMKASPEKPVMSQVPAVVDAGLTINVSCSVTHTCPSHPPVFSWSVPYITHNVTNVLMSRGVWETTSTITFMAGVGDGVKSLNCTAVSWRGKERSSTVKLTVRGSLMYQLRSSLPVALPVSIGVLVVVILAAVFLRAILRRRRYLMRKPPRPEKRRYNESSDRPSRPERRRSIWNRFSRSQEHPVNLSIEHLNNCTQISKQRFPSPKDKRRSHPCQK